MNLSVLSKDFESTYLMFKGEKEPDLKFSLLRYYYAYHGNLELYKKVVNLENLNDKECACIAEGCYQNFEFAKWCLKNIPLDHNKIHSSISAQFIMNNDLSYVRDDIYCIWYPHAPKESTLRQLLKLKPSFKYLIARACVVGNYINFYKELDVLPEIHIVKEIASRFDLSFLKLIVGKSIYQCMDDRTHVLRIKPVPFNDPDFNHYYDIATYSECIENRHSMHFFSSTDKLDENDIKLSNSAVSVSKLPVIDFSPFNAKMYVYEHFHELQSLIPIYKMINRTCKSDTNITFLRHYYAYHGKLQQYLEVVDPDNIDDSDYPYITRGCQLNLEFAKWCFENISPDQKDVHGAISGRFIVNDNLSYIHDNTCCIWYPMFPSECTLRKLYKIKPSFKYLIARACVHGNYKSLYKELNIIPDVHIINDIIKIMNIGFLELFADKFDFSLQHAKLFNDTTVEYFDFYKKMDAIKWILNFEKDHTK